MEASKQQFYCANPDKSEKTKQRINKILKDEDVKLDFNRHKSHPVPSAVLVNITNLYCYY